VGGGEVKRNELKEKKDRKCEIIWVRKSIFT
jgi:hypothetical protein